MEDDTPQSLVRWPLRKKRVETFRQQPRQGRTEQNQLGQARPSPQHADRSDDWDSEQRSELHDADERCSRRVRELIHQPEQVDFRATRITRTGSYRSPNEEQQTEDET
jgi:hypothetical protein